MKEMNEMKETKLAKKSNDFFELVIIYSEALKTSWIWNFVKIVNGF